MTEKRFADLSVQLWRAHKRYEQQARVVHRHRNHPARLRDEIKTLRRIERPLQKVLREFNEALLGEI